MYLGSPLSKGQLADIIPGQNKRVVFVWNKSREMNELYKQWCNSSKNKEDGYGWTNKGYDHRVSHNTDSDIWFTVTCGKYIAAAI